jgi:hypothetical protein
MKLIEQICKLWWVEAGRDLTNPYSRESLQALDVVLREDFDFNDDIVEYVMESIMRTPTHFKVGGDTDSGIDVDDDETAVSAILSRDELIALAQHSEFLDEEEEEDDKQDADDDIKNNSLTQYEKDRLNESLSGVFELDIVKQLGGNDITQDDLDKISKLQPTSLSPGSKNTYDSNKKQWTFDELNSELLKHGKLIITTAGSVTKVRTQYGERICQLSKTVNQQSDKHLSRVYTLLKLTQLGVEIKSKVAPGIGYETMQVDNLDNWVKDNMEEGTKPLPLFIAGKDTGVKINGGAKISGVPKSDLGFGIDGKPNFFISYKHGAMFDPSGNQLKSAFQQYGSVSSFFNKKFTAEMDKKPSVKKMIDSFVEAVKKEVKKSGVVYKNVTEIKNDGKKWIVVSGKKEIVPKDQNDQIWAKNRVRVNKAKPKNLYVLENQKGWSRRRSLLDSGQAGQDIAMMSIFGNDYFTGKAGVNNCNILMQDNAGFKIGKRVDEDGVATAIEMSVSSAGHVMFNPKIYGNSDDDFPSFGAHYEPYFVARYTGEMAMKTKDGMMIGVRLLIMPASQTKGGDI